MNGTRHWLVGFVPLVVLGGVASASFSLEKAAVRIDDLERPKEWSTATTCEVAYYNFCTGWVWVWSDWVPADVVGVCYEVCCSEPWLLNRVHVTSECVWTGAPPGWGYTGVIGIWSVDGNRCPVSSLANQPFYFMEGWNVHGWDTPVPGEFLVTVTFDPSGYSPARLASDHPAAGPTGPQACGTCYQLHRLTRSYHFGTAGSLLCPGEKLNDGVCDVEWYWDVVISCESAVDAGGRFGTAASWAAVKALYR